MARGRAPCCGWRRGWRNPPRARWKRARGGGCWGRTMRWTSRRWPCWRWIIPWRGTTPWSGRAPPRRWTGCGARGQPCCWFRTRRNCCCSLPTKYGGWAAGPVRHSARAGATGLLVSHEEELLLQLADEVWWLDGGTLAGRGDPAVMLRAYAGHIARRVREWGAAAAPVAPRWRRGDGRVRVENLELLGESGQAAGVVRSGELVVVRATLRVESAVAEPVAGMMIRSRAGMNVYGTNSELEGIKLGPCAAGEVFVLDFAFRFELCADRKSTRLNS